jgi:hypothetical protein
VEFNGSGISGSGRVGRAWKWNPTAAHFGGRPTRVGPRARATVHGSCGVVVHVTEKGDSVVVGENSARTRAGTRHVRSSQ